MPDKPDSRSKTLPSIVAAEEEIRAIRDVKALRQPPRRTGRALGKAEVAQVFSRFRAADPEPRGELTFINTFTLLVAIVLSAQATDVSVNKATPPLFAIAETPQKMLELGEERIRDFIKTVGLYRAKAKNVVALSRRLVEVYGGEVPDNRADLESLPGVGRKTANVLLNSAYGVAVIAVDTHLFESPTVFHSPKARRRSMSSWGWRGPYRPSSNSTPTTGSSCTGAMSARRANRHAAPA